MKQTILLVLWSGILFLQAGCVALPPLVQVSRPESEPNLDTRLRSIERRLERIEEKLSPR